MIPSRRPLNGLPPGWKEPTSQRDRRSACPSGRRDGGAQPDPRDRRADRRIHGPGAARRRRGHRWIAESEPDRLLGEPCAFVERTLHSRRLRGAGNDAVLRAVDVTRGAVRLTGSIGHRRPDRRRRTDSDTYPDVDPGRNAGRDSRGGAHPVCRADSSSDADAGRHRDAARNAATHADGEADTAADTATDTATDAEAHTAADAEAHGDAAGDPDARALAGGRQGEGPATALSG